MAIKATMGSPDSKQSRSRNANVESNNSAGRERSWKSFSEVLQDDYQGEVINFHREENGMDWIEGDDTGITKIQESGPQSM